MIIGVTGLIGSGKSEAAAVMAQLGAELIDCDRIGKDIVENDSEVLHRLTLEFGKTILTQQSRLDRRYLGRLAFSTRQNTEMLNAIVHPPLLAELDRRLEAARKEKRHAVVDAALLIYWDYQRHMDCTILISAHTQVRIRRLLGAGLNREEIRQRMQSQLPLSQMRRGSDYVITNNEDLGTLQLKAKTLYLKLIGAEIG
jgi:dephospho-CoA kinase